MAKRKYAKRKRAKRSSRKRTVKSTVKSVIKSMSETKFKNITLENVQLYHNSGALGGPVCYGNLLRTDVGTSQVTRNGDSVYGTGLNLKFWLSTKKDRPNVMFRVMIISTPTNEANSANPSALFRGDNGNKMMDYVNTDVYKIVYSKVIKITHGDTSFEIGDGITSGSKLHEVSKFHKIFLKLNRKVSYQTDTGGTPIPRDARNCLSLVVIPYDSYGTLTTDDIATLAICGKFYYKDF